MCNFRKMRGQYPRIINANLGKYFENAKNAPLFYALKSRFLEYLYRIYVQNMCYTALKQHQDCIKSG